MLQSINYEDILIIGISSGMTMGIISRFLSYVLYAFRTLVKDSADI